MNEIQELEEHLKKVINENYALRDIGMKQQFEITKLKEELSQTKGVKNE